MNVFEKLISEFSSMTGMELAPDRNDSCSLAYDGKGTGGAFLGLVQGSTKTCVTFCRAA